MTFSKPKNNKKIIIKIISFTIYIIFFPFLSHRVQYWLTRISGVAYTMRNKKHFKFLGNEVFLSSDITVVGASSISIGEQSSVGSQCALTVWGINSGGNEHAALEVGRYVSIGAGAHITAANQIKIGDGVLLGKYVTISDNNHGATSMSEVDTPPAKRPLVSKGRVLIGDNVWIGDKATILGGVTIGKSAVIAANSVVTCNIPEFCIAAGVPAKIIKTLSN